MRIGAKGRGKGKAARVDGFRTGSTSEDRSDRGERTAIFARTKMCKFFILGACSKGADCKFAHSPEELAASPDLQRTKLCRTLLATGKCVNPNCTYAHHQGELKPLPGEAAAWPGAPPAPARPPEPSGASCGRGPWSMQGYSDWEPVAMDAMFQFQAAADGAAFPANGGSPFAIPFQFTSTMPGFAPAGHEPFGLMQAEDCLWSADAAWGSLQESDRNGALAPSQRAPLAPGELRAASSDNSFVSTDHERQEPNVAATQSSLSVKNTFFTLEAPSSLGKLRTVQSAAGRLCSLGDDASGSCDTPISSAASDGGGPSGPVPFSTAELSDRLFENTRFDEQVHIFPGGLRSIASASGRLDALAEEEAEEDVRLPSSAREAGEGSPGRLKLRNPRTAVPEEGLPGAASLLRIRTPSPEA